MATLASNPTWTPIQTQTLTSNQTTVSFTSISTAYTDLILVMTPGEQTSQTNGVRIRVGNGSTDSGSNYSLTYMIGNGSTATSQRQSNISYFDIAWNVSPSSTLGIMNAIVQFQNYSNTTTYKTALFRINNAGVATEANVGLWRSIAAINTIDIYTSGGSSNQLTTGSTFTLYGIASSDLSAYATGGMIYSDSTYYYHAFTGSGTFTPNRALSADILVVAGGGGGGAHGGNGGGGGGGGITGFASQSLTSGTTYLCTVGAGGTGGTSGTGDSTQGGNSQFASLTAAVGGGSGTNWYVTLGTSGGSGGGAWSAGSLLAGTANQGNSGGNGLANGSNYTESAGGGGGAGNAGGNGTSSTSGAGGAGANSGTLIAGTAGPYAFIQSMGAASGYGQLFGGNYYFAGGGGAGAPGAGSVTTGGAGGVGGGGAGGSRTSAGTNGTTNTGGGGGGGTYSGSPGTAYSAGNGGSGIVIVRYAK